MKLSIVATLYQSAPYISEFCERVSAAAKLVVHEDYEIVLVNDGSMDESLEIATKLTKFDRHIVLVDLSRNFGHHKAIMTGLSFAKGDDIFLLDSDLEEDPEWLIEFFALKKVNKCDVTYGVQERRKGRFFEIHSGKFFYYIFNLLADINLPRNITVARLMSHRYVKALLQHKESEIFIAGLWEITGFNQIPVEIHKHYSGRTTYTFKKKLLQLINAVTSFSSAPLAYIFFLGLIIFAASSMYLVYLVVNWIFLSRPPSGYTSLIVSIWFLGSMIMVFLGVIGIYLTKIYSETKNRPYTIIRDVIRGGINQV